LGVTGQGGGVATSGNEEGKGIIEDESGLSPTERVRRRIRGGIKIGYDEKPNNMEGWMDPGEQAIIINKGHP
jgi:hypothetical protein